jgi:N-acyl-phosphatidylethanolamine-hydrolysing phospholipase D
MGPTQRLYFSGDTGYCSVFKAVGQTHGPFDVALLPIGAYCPRDFMQPAHIDPAEAVKIHIELQARTSIGMHWGTFVLYVLTQQEVDSHRSLAHAHTHTLSLTHSLTLAVRTDEPIMEPPQRLRAELEAQGIPLEQFVVMEHGESRLVLGRSTHAITVTDEQLGTITLD